MPIRRIGYACPICDHTGITSHLYEAPPALATRCETNGDHVWTDSNALREMQPRMLELPKPVAVHINRLPLNLQLPEQLLKNLQLKYGEALNERLIGVLQYCAQPQFLFLGSDDLERIQEKLGCALTNGSELYGALFQMGEQMADLKMQVKQLTRASTMRSAGTGVLLDMGEMLPKAVGKAAENNMAVDEFLGTYLREALLNDWVVI